MRIIVFFDLPVTTAAKRKAANQFRQFLLKDGYQMLQLSVYSRIVKGRDSLQKHHNRLCANLPQEGSIRCLEVTEKQYATMKLLLGELKTQEKRVNSDQLLLEPAFTKMIKYLYDWKILPNRLNRCPMASD